MQGLPGMPWALPWPFDRTYMQLALLAGIVVGALLFVRRISMKTYVPYGPFLIAGILWVMLGLPQR